MAIPPLNFKQLIPSTDGWLKAGSKLGRHRKVPGAEGARGRAALDLFKGLRGIVISGRWEDVYAMFSVWLRGRVTPERLARHLERNAAPLRKAYRDASVERVTMKGSGAQLEINWGRAGYALPDLKLVHEDGSWRFDAVPWGTEVISRTAGTREGEASKYLAATGASRWGRRRAGRLTWGFFLLVFLSVPAWLALTHLLGGSLHGSAPVAAVFLVTLAAAVTLVLARPSRLRRRSGQARERR